MSIPNRCPSCGETNIATSSFYSKCGAPLSPAAGLSGYMPGIPADVNGKKIAAGVCGILLGSLGAHKFVLA